MPKRRQTIRLGNIFHPLAAVRGLATRLAKRKKVGGGRVKRRIRVNPLRKRKRVHTRQEVRRKFFSAVNQFKGRIKKQVAGIKRRRVSNRVRRSK